MSAQATAEPQPKHPKDLLNARHQPIKTIDELRGAAQLAIQVELTTIPPYLTALYSIADRTSEAYQALRSVVIEEMFHVNLASNILVGIGGKPRFTGDVVPRYPTYLPSANQNRTPYIGLHCASPAVFRNVFMGIETPAAFNAPPEGKTYDTIAQLYRALLDGIEHCVKTFGEKEVFTQDPEARQRTDIYLGRFGGEPVHVDSLGTAKEAIKQIVAQGEGAVDPDGMLVAQESYGAYHHYGNRTDGTYGPILGKPLEDSHYVRFLRTSNAAGFPPTLPIVSNPRISDFHNETAIHWAVAFNKAYSLMLRTLEMSFEAAKEGADPYFQLTLPLMHQHLARMANTLMNTPIQPNGNASVGPNAAPTFEYDPKSSFEEVIEAIAVASGAAAAAASGAATADDTAAGAVFAAPIAYSDNTPRAAAPAAKGNGLIQDFEELKRRAGAARIRL
jgi:hypothetical protein